MTDRGDRVNELRRRDHTSLDIRNNRVSLVESIQSELDKASSLQFGKRCIYKVHEKFRKINKYAYTPEKVSIGPFHHHVPSLGAMDDIKLLYVNTLLARLENRENKLKECVDAIRNLQKEARKCYSEHFDLDENKFTRMMLVDGLFIIELFRRAAQEEAVERGDPIFSNIWAMPSLVRDLVLFENQLPMVVLETLFRITVANKGGKSLKELAIRFFDPLMHRSENVIQNCFDREGKHLLDLLGKTFHNTQQVALPQEAPQNQSSNNNISLKCVPCMTQVRKAGVKFKVFFRRGRQLLSKTLGYSPKETTLPLVETPNNNLNTKLVRCVSELLKAGVKFRKGNDEGNFLDIKFVNGLLQIPPLLIQDQTETILRNLVASEQYSDGDAPYVTSYAFLMDSLIDSSNDVMFLRDNGIITNSLGDDNQVSSLFNELCLEATNVNFQYSGLCNELNAFHGNRCNVWRAELHEYFRTPWTTVATIVAAILLILTAIQTFFAVFAYFRPSS